MQRFVRVSQCVQCELRLTDADPHVSCPRCGSALLAVPDVLLARRERSEDPLARLRDLWHRLLGR